ncbi:Acetylcholine receptor subunit alpha-type unc-38 [Schistosoma japonicum]|uniref:Acetylcholine receptor subunit alpha-type unc-38 n=1 Tax=Schistosoma japonicum TaxID=6182 RepID=A0A4Z2CQC0_SCHJA|nr:Acetylcholine receptor subunit alpha-type unc-38 [Schistosoma japonicum]
MKNYESSVRPLKNISEKLTVKISIRLQQIGGLNERNQVLTTILFLEQIWEDDYLKWNESEFGNVRTLRIPAKQVWTPDTYVFNNADHTNSGFLEGIYVIIHSSGKVSWPIPVQLKTSCKVDITLFPFDHQNCEIQFGSWMYKSDWIEYKFQMNPQSNSITSKNWEYSTKILPSLVSPSSLSSSLLSNNNSSYATVEKTDENVKENDEVTNNFDDDYLTRNALDISSYWDSTDWMLKQSSLSYTYRSTDQLTVWKPTTKSTGILNIESHDNKLNIKKQTDLVLKLFLQRRSFFYIWNIVIPCILLTLLTLVTFWTPIDSGEKITLGLSVFLAFSMFMMLIAERVPPTSKNIPLIGVYMTSVMTLTTGSVVVCVIVINLDSRGEKLTRVPKLLRRLSKLSIFQLFYKENYNDMSKSAYVSSMVEKLSISNSNQEKKLFEIGYQISILSKLNQLLRKEQNLTEEIQSIYQKYCHLLHFMKKFPLNEIPTNSIYHHDVHVEEDENHLNSQHHLSSSMKSSTLLKVKLPTTSNKCNQYDHLIEQNCLLNNYLPSSILHDSIELLNNNSHTSISNVHNNVNFTNMHQLNSKNYEKVKHELIKYEWKVGALEYDSDL